MKKKIKIIFTGGNGRFGKVFKKKYNQKNILYPTSKELNVKNISEIKNFLSKYEPKYFVHAAAISRPMDFHNKNIAESISTNIIGTCNVVKACLEKKIKLIYFSTNYVYPEKKGCYSENSPLLPINNYAWSKLGGEAAVQMYKNSLILRICMTEKPFNFKKAYTNLKTNLIFHEDLVNVFFKIINKKGIINIGGKSQSVFNFAKKYNKNIKKKKFKKNKKNGLAKNSTMKITKFLKILKKI